MLEKIIKDVKNNDIKIKENFDKDGNFLKNKKIVVNNTNLKAWLVQNDGQKFKSALSFIKTFKNVFGVNLFQKDIKYLENLKYIKRDGRNIEIVAPEDLEEKPVAQSANQVINQKAVKYKIPQGSGKSKLKNIAEEIVLHLLGNEKGNLLLTGEPGTGKTRTIETIASLLKLQCVTIEAPHISEENIINIPYLIRRGNNEDSDSMSVRVKGDNDFEVINAESSLITQLKEIAKKPIKDAEYNAFLNSNKILKPIQEELDYAIQEVNKKYKVLLFIDELYRTGSARIKNLLRTILNGRLGNTPIPNYVAIIFASNMNNEDGSLDEIPLNHQFSEIDFNKPSKEDFLRYIADKFTNIDPNTGEPDSGKISEINIKPEVYNAFADNLTDQDLGSVDKSTEAGIRVSPRRWEEIIKYVNANLPVENEQQARDLLSFLKNNMSDYTTNETSIIYDKYKKVLINLINKTSGMQIKDLEPNSKKEWRKSLANELDSKLRLGNERKYIPVVSGLPGIGKTKMIHDLTKERKMNLITIDASTLNADDCIGLSVPQSQGGTLVTKFSDPPLYTKIMTDYEKVEDSKQKYTNILFIDEISRTGCFGGMQEVDVQTDDPKFLAILKNLK